MKTCVLGFGHFASVLAAVLASRSTSTTQCDLEPHLIRENHVTADQEPGWEELAAPRVIEASQLSDCEIVWAAYDVPLLPSGQSDDAAVLTRLRAMLRHCAAHTVVAISSQWRVGTTRQLEAEFPSLLFAYIRENVRVHHAIGDLMRGDTWVIGVRHELAKWALWPLLQTLDERAVWVSIEAAEMSKHVLNAHLGMDIAFINEVARLCALHDVDPSDIHRALVTDRRISPDAPLKAGGPFGGGSLKRDLLTLNQLAADAGISTPILSAILPSNEGR